MSWRPELGAGPLNSDLWVIGRDFSVEDARAGQPLQGQAGQLFGQTLRFAGIDRDAIRVDTLVPMMPHGTGNWSSRSPEDMAWCRERLTRLLASAKPKLIVALGDEAAAFLLSAQCPDDGINSFRGYLWDTAFGRVLTTVNPVGVLRDWTPWRALLNLDFRRAAAELSSGCPALNQREVTIVTSPTELEDLRDTIRSGDARRGDSIGGAGEAAGRGVRNGRHQANAAGAPHALQAMSNPASEARWLAVDIENHADLTLACMGFAPSPQRAWVIPAVPGWQLEAIRELSESAVPKVLQNGQFDRFFLRRFCGIELRNHIFDVMLAWHSISPELAGKKLHTDARKKTFSRTTVKSLKFLSSVYTRDRFWKGYNFANEDERYILCGRDCCVTLDIALKQARQLEAV